MKKEYIFIMALMIVYFFNRWIPSASEKFNIVSPSLNVPNVDFYAYYLGGQAYTKGIEPYFEAGSIQSYIYPPTFLPLYGLFSHLDYDTARHVWLAFYALLFLCAAGFMLHRIPPPQRSTAMLILAGLALFSYPLIYLIRQGQMDLVSSSLSFVSLLFYSKKRPAVSACFLAIATLVKFNPLMLLATYVIFLRDWKYLIRYILFLVSLALLSCLFFPPAWYAIFFTQVLPSLTRSIPHIYNQTPLRLFAGDPFIPRLITLTGYACLCIFAFWIGRKLKEKETHQILAFYLLNVATMLLLSGSAWVMAYTWFLLPVAPLLAHLVKQESRVILALISLSAILMQSTPHSGCNLFSDSVNMIGAALCALCTAWILVQEAKVKFPRSRTKEQHPA